MTFTLKRALGVVVFLVLAGLWIFFQQGDRPVEQPWKFLHGSGHNLIMLVLGLWTYFELNQQKPDPVLAHQIKVQKWLAQIMVVLALASLGFELYALANP